MVDDSCYFHLNVYTLHLPDRGCEVCGIQGRLSQLLTSVRWTDDTIASQTGKIDPELDVIQRLNLVLSHGK
jgi:hypothetical protein